MRGVAIDLRWGLVCKLVSILYMKRLGVKQWMGKLIPYRKFSLPENPGNYEIIVDLPDKQSEWTSAEAEIINQMIDMGNIIRIAKHINYTEYLSLNEINSILCEPVIDTHMAKKALLGGIAIQDQNSDKIIRTEHLPFQYNSVRSLLWKISSGYLPHDEKHRWVVIEEKGYAEYHNWVKELIIKKVERKLTRANPQTSQKQMQEKTEEENLTQQTKDHPLNFSDDSKWKNHFSDIELWKKIEKDTKRTKRDCKFFKEENSVEYEERTIKPCQLSFSEDLGTLTYTDSLTRIIFIYLKKHPEEQYHQGMNELAALFFYAYTNKNSQYFRRVNESDAYFLLELILGRLPKKHFERGRDYVEQFLEVLKKVDLRLYEELQEKKMEDMIKLVTMRWFMTGFLNEFNIDSGLLVWDMVLTWPHGQSLIDCFIYIALAVFHLNRKEILEAQNLAVVLGTMPAGPVKIIDKALSLHQLFPELLSDCCA